MFVEKAIAGGVAALRAAASGHFKTQGIQKTEARPARAADRRGPAAEDRRSPRPRDSRPRSAPAAMCSRRRAAVPQRQATAWSTVASAVRARVLVTTTVLTAWPAKLVMVEACRPMAKATINTAFSFTEREEAHKGDQRGFQQDAGGRPLEQAQHRAGKHCTGKERDERRKMVPGLEMVALGDVDAGQHRVAGHVGGEHAAHGDVAHRVGDARDRRSGWSPARRAGR